MNDTPLHPWVIASPDGVIQSAHCDCMAGLGEVCTHVGALLYWVDSSFRANSRMTVTQKKAYWPVPGYVDKVPYAEIRDIDFTSADVKRRNFDCAVNGDTIVHQSRLKLPDVPEPTDEEMEALKLKLAGTYSKPAVLSVMLDYQEDYVPEILKEGSLPICLTTLRDNKFLEMDKDELLLACVELYESLSVSLAQVNNAEYLTREQSKVKEWYSLRQGRITASNMKSVCVGNLEKPAKSTVKNLCGGGVKFSNKATRWGCQHEGVALESHKTMMAATHTNLSVEKSGFVISKEHPHIGASPDAVMSCDCCGEGVVEIKCPFCVRKSSLTGNTDKVDCVDEASKQKKDHQYAYQVQTQLLVTKRDFCDFVVWTEIETSVERILPDNNFHRGIIEKSREYFMKIILPEITGNLFSRENLLNSVAEEPNKKPVLSERSERKDKQACDVQGSSGNSTVSTSEQPIICVCKTKYNPSDDDVIGCDNENCPYVWLHFKCIKLKRVP